jgi:hypothetical protein
MNASHGDGDSTMTHELTLGPSHRPPPTRNPHPHGSAGDVRRRLLAACVLLALLIPARVDAALAAVSRAQGGGASSTSTCTTPAQSHTAGNLLVAVFSWRQNAFSSIANTAGDTWVQAGTQQTFGTHEVRMYYVNVTAGNGSDVVTVTLTGNSDYRSCVVREISGQATSSVLGSTAAATGSSTAIDSGNVSVAASSEIIVAFAIQAPTMTPGTGYTGTNFAVSGDATAYYLDEYHIVTASEHATATGPNAVWGIFAASFKDAAGGTPSSLPAIINTPIRGGGGD